MAGRRRVNQPDHPWRSYSTSYVDNDSVKMILTLHEVERQLRKEIENEQVTHWSKEEIRRVYGD